MASNLKTAFGKFTIRTDKKGSRKVAEGRQDAISKGIANCATPEDFVKLGNKFGIREAEVVERATAAPNFGQFRMTMGNRLRGIVARLEEAKENGKKITAEEAAYPKEARAKAREERKAAKAQELKQKQLEKAAKAKSKSGEKKGKKGPKVVDKELTPKQAAAQKKHKAAISKAEDEVAKSAKPRKSSGFAKPAPVEDADDTDVEDSVSDGGDEQETEAEESEE